MPKHYLPLPPKTLRAVDVLLPNFHLPKSTLLMLISAFAGREFILRAYAEAVRDGQVCCYALDF